MSEAALWVNYLLGGVVAAVVAYAGVRIIVAIPLCAAMTIGVWLLVPFLKGSDFSDPWFLPGLIINACFALAFSGGGAAFGRGMKEARKSS